MTFTLINGGAIMLNSRGRIVVAIILCASLGYIVNVCSQIVRYPDTEWVSEAKWLPHAEEPSFQQADYKGKIVFAITSPVNGLSRRDIIRYTWISDLKKLGYGEDLVKTFFYMSTPDKIWERVINSEQDAHKDLFIIRSLKIDNRDLATTVKTTEMYTQFIEDNTVPLDEVRWFCKVDDDSYLVVKPLMEQYLLNSSIVPDRTLIGRTLTKKADNGAEFVYPGGQFVCTSPDLIHLFSEKPPKIRPNWVLDGSARWSEDVLIGEVLYKFHEDFTMIDLPNNVAHDVPREVTGENDVTKWMHSPTDQSINPHKMKDDPSFLKVANMYNENGWLGSSD